jgi:hypothetical protein
MQGGAFSLPARGLCKIARTNVRTNFVYLLYMKCRQILIFWHTRNISLCSSTIVELHIWQDTLSSSIVKYSYEQCTKEVSMKDKAIDQGYLLKSEEELLRLERQSANIRVWRWSSSFQNILFEIGDVVDLPFENNSFDVVWSKHLLQ